MTTPYQSLYTGPQVDSAVAKALVTVSGTLPLGSGVQEGQVAGLGLSFTPTEIFLQVEVPDSSEPLLLFAVTIRGTISSDGFSFYLSGLTDSDDYRLHYLILGSGDEESEP